MNNITTILNIINNIEHYCDDLFENAPNEIDSYDLKENQTSVTKFDIEITKYCIKTIHNKLKNSNIIIEEDNSTAKNNFKNLTWVIDPLDGTASFIRGYPIWGIGIGIFYQDRAILSYFYAPKIRQRFLTYDNKNYLNNKLKTFTNIEISDDTKTALISSKLHNKINLSKLKDYKIRNFGSTIYHLFLVANNSAELCIIGSCYLWDISAVFYLAEINNCSFYEYNTNKKIEQKDLTKYFTTKIDTILCFRKVTC